MSGDSDRELLEKSRAGDRAALEELLARHQGQVYRFALQMCRHPEDAKDVLQDTLLAAARGVREFRGASSVSTWLYAIARSFCIKQRRRGKDAPVREASLEGDARREIAELANPGKSPEEAVAGKQVERALEQAIQVLEPKEREVLLLRDVEGLTAPETAEVLGVTVQAVKSRLHRARRSLRANVAPLLAPAEPIPGRSNCPDISTEFSKHLEGEISADDCARMEAHLEACTECRGACESLKRTLALCRLAGKPVEVPSPVQAAVKVALRNFFSSAS